MRVWIIRMLCIVSFSYLAFSFPFISFRKGMDSVQQVDYQIGELEPSLSSEDYLQLKSASTGAIEYVIELRDIFLFKQRIAYGLAMFFSLMCFSLSFKLRLGVLSYRGVESGT
jgi:hypothetical protein